jgi:hypothetical protein
LPEDLAKRLWDAAAANQLRQRNFESFEIFLAVGCLAGKLRVCGINHKGQFKYYVQDGAATPLSVARAHQARVVELIQRRLRRYRRFDDMSILLMGLTGVFDFTGIDRQGNLEITVCKS